MRITLVKVDHPYYGARRFTPDVHGLEAALGDDHPCEDVSCDIATMVANSFYYVAAHSLQGATECECVDAVLAAMRFNGHNVGTHMYDAPDWEGWKAHHDEYGVECGCGAFNYSECHWYPQTCGNCGADLPQPADDSDDD